MRKASADCRRIQRVRLCGCIPNSIQLSKGNTLLDGDGGGGSAIAMMFSFNGLCLLYKMRRGGGGTGDHYTLVLFTRNARHQRAKIERY